MQEVVEFLKQCKYYFLGTVDGDTPRMRPFGTAHIIDGRLCFQTGRKKPVAQQILSNPNVCICAYDGDAWLRINAKALPDDRVETQLAMLEAYPQLKSMYAAGDGNTQIFYLSDATATYYGFGMTEKVITF
ncbi:MAG: pyridoxamine 5'-phosphate oxidase family protein [Propionibacteriaceae bacterium]|jgi:uncharacterized pyridoxamine 5'-phosphate oxidase family protein|nr:pyridoxamine 5'-phosphate oxidase family protein [Propionibacteriaceae bacterium]